MHLVGTIRMNKAYLPSKTFIQNLRIPKDDSLILHYRDHPSNLQNMSLVVKKVRASKYVGIISTLHHKLTVVENNKTQAHMFYNAGKGGTDAFDQRCATTSCRRKTRRWSMAVFYQTVNIAMNNAWILYHESGFQRETAYSQKADYLHEIAYRMARPFAVHKYQHTDPRKSENRLMINMVFRLSPDEKLRQPPAPVAPQDAPAAPAVAADIAPVAGPAVAEFPIVVPTPAQIATAAAHGYVMPNIVDGAIREPITERRVPVTPYLGGRWASVDRIRCTLCPRPNNYRGKFRCEMPDCGHRNVCAHHSVLLCQICFHRDNIN